MKKQFSAMALLIMISLQTQSATNITDGALKEIGGKLPDIPVVDKTINEIEQTIPQMPPEIIKQINQNLTKLDNSVINSIDPLAELDARLEIKGPLGETLLIEEAVEGGWRAVEGEWIVIASEGDIALLEKLKLDILSFDELKGVGMTVVRFKTPIGYTKQNLIEELPERLSSQLGRNHIYKASAKEATSKLSSAVIKIKKSACADVLNIGIIDTAVNESHQAFVDVTIRQENFMDEKFKVPNNHGTAVAGLLVGKDALTPLLPGGNLYAASVFYARNKYSQGATLMHLLEAINWLVEKRVPIINMSLTGPPNPILEQAIKGAHKSNTIIVAAAGNEGPAASPRYPAAYEDVIAVTAVDHQRNIYRWANQGDYIDFAALGVGINTARNENDYGSESGTSMASPIVAAHLACQFLQTKNKAEAIKRLENKAIDLGQKGKDNVFGYGYIE